MWSTFANASSRNRYMSIHGIVDVLTVNTGNTSIQGVVGVLPVKTGNMSTQGTFGMLTMSMCNIPCNVSIHMVVGTLAIKTGHTRSYSGRYTPCLGEETYVLDE